MKSKERREQTDLHHVYVFVQSGRHGQPRRHPRRDVLELILLCLESPIWLLRAASTCKRWRRVIACAGSLRRCRALHNRAPIIAGSYYNSQNLICRPRFEPSPSLASAVDGRHFSLDFLPMNGSNNHWKFKDSRGTLLLINREDFKTGHQDLIVCEPLARRYQMVPPMTASVRCRGATALHLDSESLSEGGGIGMSNYRVFCLDDHSERIHAGIDLRIGQQHLAPREHRQPAQALSTSSGSPRAGCTGTTEKRWWWR